MKKSSMQGDQLLCHQESIPSKGTYQSTLEREERPPHVHVHLGKGKPNEPQVKVWLGGESEEEGKKPSLGPVKNKMTEGDAQRALESVKQHLGECWKVRREYNGHL